ncbi:MAG: tRNA (N6-isopentenyl adenosine(37)-C2)-methylthiotransferase MiaB [Deltaproteobacteria bacterium]|nr:tRNA (N6-isopentenyl adenosine(37)-C2)-methylthiotransferase MiaB [Deltaproteobacteria bacterium]
MKYFIDTFGCQMNVRDSGEMADALREAGYEPAEAPGEADLILVNTCTVRQKAAHKGVSAVGRYVALKKENPKLVVGACGCYAQEAGERLLQEVRGVDIVAGPDAKGQIASLVEERRGTKKPVVATELHGSGGGASRDSPAPTSRRRTPAGPTALVTIMQGCDNYCSFCVVPYVRGPEVSRPPDEIVAEVRDLAAMGVREVTLLGQNVNSYGAGTGADFAALLDLVCAVSGIARVRFTTSHPKDLTERLAERFATLPALMPQIHLPVQSGSDTVLARMNRKHTRGDYLDKVTMLRRHRPGIAVTTDIIVGFPGETAGDFAATISLVREVVFDGAFSFKYSPRPGTAASRLDDDVPPDEKSRRLSVLQEILDRMAFERSRALVGAAVPVLVEGPARDPGTVFGRTPCNRVVNFVGNGHDIGAILEVDVNEALAHSLLGMPSPPR